MENRIVDKEKTIESIINTCKKSGIRMDMIEWEKRMSEPDDLIYILEAAELVDAKVMYVD